MGAEVTLTLVGAHRDSLIAATQSLTKKEIGVYVFFYIYDLEYYIIL